MSRENIFTILERNDLDCTSLNYSLYEEFSNVIVADEGGIIQKIIKYNDYLLKNHNKYPDHIMRYLRQRRGLEEFDFSKDEELNKISPTDAFEHVVEWNGLLGGYASTIKRWINDIYGIDLDDMKEDK